MHARYRILVLALAALLLLPALAGATEVWAGATYYFEKANYADWTMPENQDQITPNVHITRANTKGIFNIVIEDEFDDFDFLSPLDTEWAVGDAEDWMNLSFSTWDNWHGACPPCALDVPSVVHLITDDIYIDITVVEWTTGGAGGGFAYWRGEGVTPTEDIAFSQIKALYR
jgi:hypothetical protein